MYSTASTAFFSVFSPETARKRLRLGLLAGLTAIGLAHGAGAQEIRAGSMNPDVTEQVAQLPLGYEARWENYTPDGRFFAETVYTLAERTEKELIWEVRHFVLADETISALIRQAAYDGLIAVARDDEGGIEVVTQSITDPRNRMIVKGTAFGYEYNDPHDCSFTFSLCRFTRTLPTGEIFHLVRWGELWNGAWSYRINYDPWKDEAGRREELYTSHSSVARDGLTLDEIEVWGGEVVSVRRRIEAEAGGAYQGDTGAAPAPGYSMRGGVPTGGSVGGGTVGRSLPQILPEEPEGEAAESAAEGGDAQGG